MLQVEEQTRCTPVVLAKVTTISTPTHLIGWLPLLWTRILFPGKTPSVAVSWRSFAILFGLSGVLLYPCVSFHLFEPDEGRYAQIPREMLERGEWIVPTLQGEPYLDKPPLFYWLVMLSYTLFGFSDGAARLVPAVAVHTSVLLCYVLGRWLIGERAAYWGSLLLIVSPLFLGIGRLLTLDGLLTLWITSALLASYLASGRQDTAEAGRRRFWWIAASAACGLGVLTKGPVTLLLVVPPLLAHRWLAGASSRISWRMWLTFTGVVAVMNLPWYVAVCLQRPEFLRYFLWQHNVQRFVEPFDHVRPVWFYVPILLYGLLPGILLVKPLIRYFLSTNNEAAEQRPSALGYSLLAGGWCVFFFSLAGSKLPTYILPVFPPLCLALGSFVAQSSWRRSRTLIAFVAFCWLVQFAVNYWALPAYAEHKSPMGQMEDMRSICGDADVPVVCFPRNVNSVAFYVGRSDFRTFRSKDIDALVSELQKSPRTVVLFGHRNSPETLARHLPRELQMVKRRKMGLCEMAIVECTFSTRMAPRGR